MPGDPTVFALLEEILDSGKTPEDVCRDRPELLSEVRGRWEQLRRVDAAVGALIPDSTLSPNGDTNPTAARARLPEIPGYEVEAVLGSGGMGVVYRARHLALGRTVAIKMLLAGAFAGPNELARFRREAEALAGLRHPNIVQIYDAGEVAGHPYFTMELVEGGSLASQDSTTRQPIRHAATLVATLARAVQFAHAAGIVHRDLKPGNILLSPDGTPKITDFGLALPVADGTRFTISGARVGTPSYMAPEQALGKSSAIGPAVDVYALGAVLYELLTGQPPFRGETPAEIERRVIADDPFPPSRLNATIPRDLETICLKCLGKEPESRYRSAADLADDLDRFLAGRPIQARPLTWVARLGRWCRRNPMAAVFCVVLLSSAVISTWQAVRATRAEVAANSANAQAQKRLEQIEKANDFLGSIFQNLDPKEIAKAHRPLQTILVEKLNRAAEQLEGESIGDPLVVASTQEKFALSLVALAEPDKAIALLEKAHATRQAALGKDDPLTLASGYHLAMANKAAGNLDRALPLQEETLQRMKATFGPDHLATLRCMDSLAAIYDLAGKRDLALPLFEETLRRRKATLGAKHPDTLMSMCNLGMVYFDSGKPYAALPLLEETLSLRKATLGQTHPETLDTMRKLGMTYEWVGKSKLALPLLQEALKLQRETLGTEDPDTLMSMYGLAVLYQNAGEPKLAVPLIEEALRVKTAKLNKKDPETRRTVNQVDFLRNLATAQDRYEQNLAKLGPDHIDTLLARRDIAQLYMTKNRLDEAERTLLDVIDRMKTRTNNDPIVTFTIRLFQYCHEIRQRSTPDSWLTYRCKFLLGGVFLKRKQYSEAEPLLVAGYQGMKQREAKIPAQEKVHLSEAAKQLVQLYEATGKKDEAAKWRKKLESRPKEMGTGAMTE